MAELAGRSGMRQGRIMRRRQSGTIMVDTPLTLWVLLVLFMFPMIDLAAIGIRYTFLLTSAREAVHQAARAKSFRTDIDTGNLSAVNISQDEANRVAEKFSEIGIESVTTNIVITDIISRVVSRRSLPLAAPADTANNLYEIEVVIRGRINPLITFSAGLLPGIPGLSAAMPITIAAREFCEFPQGLNQ